MKPENKNTTKDKTGLNISIPSNKTEIITNVDVVRQDGPNKRVTIIRNSKGEVTSVVERDLILDIF